MTLNCYRNEIMKLKNFKMDNILSIGYYDEKIISDGGVVNLGDEICFRAGFEEVVHSLIWMYLNTNPINFYCVDLKEIDKDKLFDSISNLEFNNSNEKPSVDLFHKIQSKIKNTVKIYKSEIQNWNPPDNIKFDFIDCSNVLHFLDKKDFEITLDKLKNCLSNNGYIFVKIYTKKENTNNYYLYEEKDFLNFFNIKNKSKFIDVNNDSVLELELIL